MSRLVFSEKKKKKKKKKLSSAAVMTGALRVKSDVLLKRMVKIIYYIFSSDLLRFISELNSIIHQVNYFISNILTS